MTGEIVSRGKIRVDARKAVAKLREHLLIDLRDYVLELMRSAIASKAETIHIGYDANDFTISWSGTPIATESLEHLLDHALATPVDNEARRLRLLALGVNAALGLNPRWVDLYVATADTCTRVRFVPSMIEQDAEQLTPSKRQVPRPNNMSANSVRIHLRERLSWHVVRRVTGMDGPPELESIADSCGHLPATLVVNGTELTLVPEFTPLLRVPFDVPGCRRAFIELMPPEFVAARLELLEQGVLLAHDEWTCEGLPTPTAQLPVRVVVDAQTLPTNASRSEVRRQSSLYRDLMATSRAALMTTLHLLVHGQPMAEDTQVFGTRAAVDEVAAAILGPVVAAWMSGRTVAPAALALLEAPLLRDGCGGPLSYSQLPRNRPLQVYRAQEPLEEALSLWMKKVVWLRGSPFEAPLRHLDLRDVSGLISRAREGVERRKVFLDHAPSEVAVVASAHHLGTARFEAGDDLAGLRGEVALCEVPGGSRGPLVRIFFEDRPLDVVELDPSWLPIPLDIALTWPERVLPTWGFDGVQRTDTLNEAIGFAVLSGAALAARLMSLVGSRPQMRSILRAAIGTVLQLNQALGVKIPFDVDDDVPSLLRARIWPTNEPDRFVSVVDLRKQISRYGALFVAPPGATGATVDGRIVVTVEERERAWLSRLLPDEALVVPYNQGLLDRTEHDDWDIKKQAAIAAAHQLLQTHSARTAAEPTYIDVTHRRARGRIGIGDPSKVITLHAGIRLDSTHHTPRFGVIHQVVDDDDHLPNETWSAGTGGSGDSLADDELGLEFELLTNVTAALEGDVAARKRIHNWPGTPSAELRRYVLTSVDKLRQEIATVALDDGNRTSMLTFYDRLFAAPIVTMIDAQNRHVLTSLVRIQQVHGATGALPMLLEAPDFPTLDWRPIVEPARDLWDFIAQATGRRAEDGTAEFSARRLAAANETRRLQVLDQPAEDLARMSEAAEPNAPVVVHQEGLNRQRVRVAVTLPATTGSELPAVEILYRGRPVFEVAIDMLPVVARVDLLDATAFRDWEQLSDSGLIRVKQELIAAAIKLVIQLVGEDAPVVTLRELDLIAALVPLTVNSALHTALHTNKWCPTVQKTTASVKALKRLQEKVYVGRTQYARWWFAKQGVSELDKPILYMPAHLATAYERIFIALGLEIEDVTATVAALQQRRSGGTTGAPTLSGTPVHSRLRESASELGVRIGVGEIELIADREADVTVNDIHGTSHQLDRHDNLPIRAVIGIDGIADERTLSRVHSELSQAVDKWLSKLSEHLHELPPFVRSHLRQRLWVRVADSELQLNDDLRTAQVWPDIRTDNKWYSIDDLLNDEFKRVWFTMRKPPYPTHDFKRPILRLHPSHAGHVDKLRAILPLTNASKRLDNMLATEARQTAAQRSEFSLNATVRDQCLATTQLDSPLTGELGVLAPTTRIAQKVEVYKTRRPVCTLDDFTWPIVAVLNDDTVDTGLYFDKLTSPAKRELSATLMAKAMELLRETLVAPSQAIASAWIDNTAELESEDDIAVVGRLWLTPSWKQHHEVQVINKNKAVTTQLCRLRSSSFFAHDLPIDGELMVQSKADLQHLSGLLAELAKAKLPTMLADAAKAFPESAEQLEGYRWLLWLIDIEVGEAPQAQATDGSDVDPARVLAELRTNGALWHAASDGSADGMFPTDPCDFMLRDDQAPILLEVLRAQLTKPALKQLGGEVVSPPQDAPAAAAPPLEHKAAVASAEPTESRSWLRSAYGSLTSLWLVSEPNDTGAPKPEPEPQHPLAREINHHLITLNMPPQDIVIEPGGNRAVRYHKRKWLVIVNSAHAAVRAIGAQPAKSPAMVSLLAAIVSELNRAHKQITAADELSALLRLM